MATTSSTLLTPEEVAQRLQVTVAWVQEMARAGLMPAIKLGRWWRFDSDEIESWLRDRGSGTYKRRTQ